MTPSMRSATHAAHSGVRRNKSIREKNKARSKLNSTEKNATFLAGKMSLTRNFIENEVLMTKGSNPNFFYLYNIYIYTWIQKNYVYIYKPILTIPSIYTYLRNKKKRHSLGTKPKHNLKNAKRKSKKLLTAQGGPHAYEWARDCLGRARSHDEK